MRFLQEYETIRLLLACSVPRSETRDQRVKIRSAKSLDAVSYETGRNGAFKCGLPRTVLRTNGRLHVQVVAGDKAFLSPNPR
jgi:hypothetical protein